MDDAAIHRVWGTRAGLSVRVMRASGSHGLSALAMTRVVFYHEGNEEIVVLTLSLRGGQNGRRGNPSCLGRCGRTVRFVNFSPFSLHPSIFTLPLTGSQWIATGYALAMTR